MAEPRPSVSPDQVSSINLDGCQINNSPYRLMGTCSVAGSFGEIYLTCDTRTDHIVATKLVDKNSPYAKLKQEYDLYIKLGPTPGLPKVYFFGECMSYHALVMELLGPNLGQVFESCNRRFNLFATTKMAIQIIDIISHIHSQKMIFCNVKPENFCLGKPNTPYATNVHLIGLIHAKPFETESHQHIPKRQIDTTNQTSNNGGFCTPRYMSLNAHKGKELSRRDDLESIGYMLIYFLRGRLPWQGLPVTNKSHKYEQILAIKKTIKIEELCRNLPSEYYHYMLYVRSLKFAQEPSYRYLTKMFGKLMERMQSIHGNQIVARDWENDLFLSDADNHNNYSMALQSNRPSLDQLYELSNQQLSTSIADNSPQTPPQSETTPPTPSRKQVSFKVDPVVRFSNQTNIYFPYVPDPVLSFFASSSAAAADNGNGNFINYNFNNLKTANNHNCDNCSCSSSLSNKLPHQQSTTTATTVTEIPVSSELTFASSSPLRDAKI